MAIISKSEAARLEELEYNLMNGGFVIDSSPPRWKYPFIIY